MLIVMIHQHLKFQEFMILVFILTSGHTDFQDKRISNSIKIMLDYVISKSIHLMTCFLSLEDNYGTYILGSLLSLLLLP